MVTGINSADSGDMQLLMAQMYQKLKAADTDSTKGLSKDELSSIGITNDAGGTAFLKSLSAQFDKLDTDSNGQLSASEIASARPPAPMGPPPGLDLGKSNSTDSTSKVDSTNATDSTSKTSSTENDSIEQMLKKLMSEIFEKLADSISGEQKSNSNASDSSKVKPADLASTDVKTNSNAGAADFINNLVNDFKSIDLDGNGQLSPSEIEALNPNNSTAATATSKLESGLSNLGNSLSSLSSSFAGKLISSYQNGTLSNIASSLSLAV